MTEVKSKKMRITNHVLSAILGTIVLGAGAFKLLNAPGYAEQVAHLNIPDVMIPIIGIIEVAGAIALLIPKVRFYGALVVGGTMLGAVVTHLIAGDFFPGALPPSVLGLLAATIAWSAQPKWLQQQLGAATA